jgi:hypothetical protein
VAFNAGNLDKVARQARKEFPGNQIIIAGDNDQWTTGNPGWSKAEAIADELKCKFLVPDFKGLDLDGKPTDFNDLAKLAGKSKVRFQLLSGIGAPTVELVPFTHFKGPQPGDDEVLIERHFLLRGQTMFISGTTGAGKSSLLMQLAIHWAVGAKSLGLQPARALRQIVFQYENHGYDLHSQWTGVRQGCGLSDNFIEKASSNLRFSNSVLMAGPEFIDQLRDGIDQFNPDLVWIDPTQNSAEENLALDAKPFMLRLIPIAQHYRIGIILMHHTAKMGGGNGQHGGKDKKSNEEIIYGAAGGHELYDMSRASMMLFTSDAGIPYFWLAAGKRSRNLGWVDFAMNPIDRRIIKQSSSGGFWWEEVEQEEYASLINLDKTSKTKPPTPGDIVRYVEEFPGLAQNQIIQHFRGTIPGCASVSRIEHRISDLEKEGRLKRSSDYKNKKVFPTSESA